MEEKQNLPKDEELSQAVARIVISGAVALALPLYVYLHDQIVPGIYLAQIYFMFAIVWWGFVKLKPDQLPARKYLSIFADLSIISIGMQHMGEAGAILYPFYLWVIIGNGIRFGSKYLYFSLVVAIICFDLVLQYTPFWVENKVVSMGLLLGIVILPLFNASLIRRVHRLNKQLLAELDRSNFAASHDDMTLLLNRSSFVQRLDEEIRRSKRYGLVFSIFYIDLNHFKHINDSFGHLQGDEVIIAIADRLKNSVRSTDIAARLGGDEFALILLSMNSEEDIHRFANKLLSAISRPLDIQGEKYRPSASIGVSQFPISGDTVESLVKAADSAMYRSKNSGKAGFELGLRKEQKA